MQVDFYILQSPETTLARHMLCCRIAEKAYHAEQTVWIQTNSALESSQVDQLLWTYSEMSFIPHNIVGNSDTTTTSPILISHQDIPDREYDNLINLSLGVPDFCHLFSRIREIVPRENAREHYRFYQNKSYQIKTHELNFA